MASLAVGNRQPAGEHFRRRAGHEDGAWSSGPVQLEVAAGEMGKDPPVGPARQDSGDADGTGAGAAGQGDAGARVPRSASGPRTG